MKCCCWLLLVVGCCRINEACSLSNRQVYQIISRERETGTLIHQNTAVHVRFFERLGHPLLTHTGLWRLTLSYTRLREDHVATGCEKTTTYRKKRILYTVENERSDIACWVRQYVPFTGGDRFVHFIHWLASITATPSLSS